MPAFQFREVTSRQPIDVGEEVIPGQQGLLPVKLVGTGASATQVQGTAADDAAVVGNPVLVGLRSSVATPSAKSNDGDAVDAWGDQYGGVNTRNAWQSDPTNDGMRVYRDDDIQLPVITTTAAAYSAGDVIGGAIDLTPTLASGNPVRLFCLALKDDLNQKPALQILFFRTAAANLTGTYTDNSAVAVSTADMAFLTHIQVIATGDWATIQGITKAAVSIELDEGIGIAPAASSVCMVIVAVGTPTYGANATSLTGKFGFERGV